MKKWLFSLKVRLMVIYKILFAKSFIVHTRGEESKTYMKSMSMNQAVLFHHELTNFLNTMISAANEQESAVAATKGIINKK